MSLLAQDERLARNVGAVTIVLLLGAIAFIVFFADGMPWGEHVRVTVYFNDTGGLREYAPVIVGGQTIGRVERIRPARIPAHLEPRAGCPPPPRRASAPGEPQLGIAVSLALDADVAASLARCGDVFVAGRSPFSARHVELGPSPVPDAPALADGDELRGIDPPTIDRVLQRTWDNLRTARSFALAVAPQFARLRLELGRLATTLDGVSAIPGAAAPPTGEAGRAPPRSGPGRLVAEIDGLTAELATLRDGALGGEAGLERIARVIARARSTIAEARATIDALAGRARTLTANLDAVRARLDARDEPALAGLERALSRARAALDRLDPLLAKVDDLRRRIERGDGSLGKLARDPEFPEDAKELGKILKRQPWKILDRPAN